MAEDSATPETGVEPIKVTDEKSSVEFIKQKMGVRPMPEQATQAKPEAKPAEEPASQEPSEESGAEAVEEAVEDSQESGSDHETEEADEEFPETLSRIAEALDVDEPQLLERIKARVKVNGEEREVTLSEALKGYSREADYIGKTESLANERKQLAEQARQLTEAQNAKLQHLEDLTALLGQQLQGGPSDADLMRILDEQGTDAYLRAKAYRDHQGQAVAQAWQTLQAEKQKVLTEHQQKLSENRAKEQAELVRALPVFADDAKRPVYESGLKTYLEKEGYSRSDIESFFNGAFDHRQVKIIDKAMKWDALKHDKAELKTKLSKLPAPKTQKPAGKSDEPKDDVAALRARLRKPARSRKGDVRNESVALVKGLMHR